MILKKLLFLILFLSIFHEGILSARKIGVLPEVTLPGTMRINEGQIYISDQKTEKTHLINLKGLTYVKQLTQRGSGPGETPHRPIINVYPDYVFLFSLTKAVYCSRDGKYLKEFRIKKRGNRLMPLVENFVYETTISKNEERWTDVSLYSYSIETDLKAVKTLYLSKNPPLTITKGKMDFHVIKESVSYTVHDDKLFLGDSSRGLYIEIFNKKGEKVGKVHLQQFEKQKVSDQYKNDYMALAKSDPYYGAASNMYNLIFPEYFPGFDYFTIDKDKIYFITYNRKGNNREVIVADWKTGKFIKKAEIPWIFNEASFNLPIENEKFYYIIENEETEEWELHVAEVR